MKYRKLGKSELRVSEVAFGCMSLKGTENENITLLRKAYDQGINFFDTADLYDAGENERIVGKALAGDRDKVIIATKVGNQLRKDGNGWDWNPSKAYIIQAVEESLNRLGTDYIDLYQLHGGTIEDNTEETIEAFERLVEQGKIRYYGISSIRPNVIRRFVKNSGIVSVMMQYSLLDRRPEEDCLDFLAENKVSVLARGVYAKGLLLGKPIDAYLNWSREEVNKTVKKLHDLSRGDLDTARSLALRYPLAHPVVAAAISGVRTSEQLDQTLQAVSQEIEIEGWVQWLWDNLPINCYENHR